MGEEEILGIEKQSGGQGRVGRMNSEINDVEKLGLG